MFQPLRFLALLLGLCLLVARPAEASHAVGGDLTYRSLGNNQYLVSLTFFRDCSGITASTTFPLTCRNGGTCNSPATVTATMTPVGIPVVSSPYCPLIQATVNCNLTGPSAANNPTSYVLLQYQATVTLSPGLWTLSTEESARPAEANITAGGTLRLEATLDSRTGLINNSPVFSHSALFDLPWKQYTIAQMGAFDPDGDSLVYTLDRPLSGCGSNEIYAAYPTLCQPVVVTTNPPCLLTCLTSATYLATLPIYVFNDTLGTCPSRTITPRFSFDAASGSIAVQPARYDSVSNSTAGTNKYVVVVKVSEYRRIGGTYVNIGSVRRELLFTVYDCGSNLPPTFDTVVGVQQGSTTPIMQPLNRIIPVVSGSPISVLLNGGDRNPGQTVSFDLSQNAVPGAQIQNVSTGVARLTFTPSASLRDGIYRVSVTISDNACPIRGIETRSLAFRVYGSPLASHSGKAITAVAAWPNPFTNEVQFQLAKAGVQTLIIADNLGRTVGTVTSLADGLVRWQPGTEVPAGLYSARTADGLQTVRLLRKAAN